MKNAAYLIWCALVLCAFAYSNVYGYVYNSVIASQNPASKAANRYHK